MTVDIAKSLLQRARTKWSDGALVAVWLIAVAAGWWCLAQYEFATFEPPTGGIVTEWPADSSLARSSTSPLLVLFLHPKCPCSRATVNELSRLLALNSAADCQAPELLVVVAGPQNADDDWWHSDTVSKSASLSHSKLVVDRAGREAARFGVTTSGTLLLFDKSGRRRYAGGITIARGHEGQSTGSDRLAAILGGKTKESYETPVFGCRLCRPDAPLDDVLVDRGRSNASVTKSTL